MRPRKTDQFDIATPEGRSTLAKNLVALAAVAVALTVRFAVDRWLGDRQPYVFFYAAVALAGAFGGWRPAILAMLLGLFLGDLFFVQPRGQLTLLQGNLDRSSADLAYAAVSLIITVITHRLHLARQNASANARELRQQGRELEIAKNQLEARVVERTAQLEQTVDELRRANQLKSEFLATMSHELRTPLNSIIGFTEIVKEGMAGPINETQKTQLGLAHSSGKHLLHLINDLLDVSRIEAGKSEVHPEWFDPAALFNEALKTIEPIARGKKITLRSDLNLPKRLHSDRKKIFQVALNLLGNAVKFTEHGEVELRAAVNHDQLRVAVRDTGLGIKAADMDMLFEAFRQVEGGTRKRYEGTGLGLYLSRQLIRLMGGDIEAESQFGKGSEFRFWIPVHVEK